MVLVKAAASIHEHKGMMTTTGYWSDHSVKEKNVIYLFIYFINNLKILKPISKFRQRAQNNVLEPGPQPSKLGFPLNQNEIRRLFANFRLKNKIKQIKKLIIYKIFFLI